MTKPILGTIGTISVLALAAEVLITTPADAQKSLGEEEWIATSTAAFSITGDIRLSPTRLRTEKADFPLRVAADLPQFEGFLGFVPARVLAVTRPANPQLLNGNRLCGGLVRWIVVSHTKEGGLELDAFTSKKMPSSVKSDGACGGLYYSKP